MGEWYVCEWYWYQYLFLCGNHNPLIPYDIDYPTLKGINTYVIHYNRRTLITVSV